MKLTSLTLSILLAAGSAAFAQTAGTEQILEVARDTWPGPQTVGIVCNYAKSGENIRAMLDAFAPGSTVKVLDVRHQEHITKACLIMWRVKPQYVLLLPADPIVHDGVREASVVIRLMNLRQIPTLATTSTALAQGALAAKGPTTGNVLQVNPAIKGYIEDVTGAPIPLGASRVVGSRRDSGSKATLSVIAAF